MYKFNINDIVISESDNVIIQFIRYGLVGAIVFIIDFSIYHLFTNILMINYLISNTISFVFALFTNYFLSRNWVFNNKNHRFGRDFTLFSIVGVIGLIFSNIILYILLDCRLLYKFIASLDYEAMKLIAKLITIFIVTFWNFIARRKFVFGIKD